MNRPKNGFGLICVTASRAGALFIWSFGRGRGCGIGFCLVTDWEEGR
jgi:hypothetical protein